MLISHQNLSDCIRTAKNIADAYRLKVPNGHNASRRSLDVLLDVCVEACQHPIEIYKGDFDENDRWLYGACLLAEDKAVVLYAHYLNSCWERFTVCKELFHVVLDKEEYRSMDIFQHIQNITLSFPDDESRPTGPVVCEFLAEVAAMEFLFPYAERKAILAANAMTPAEVAEQYKVPCLMVEKYLSHDYMDKLKDA